MVYRSLNEYGKFLPRYGKNGKMVDCTLTSCQSLTITFLITSYKKKLDKFGAVVEKGTFRILACAIDFSRKITPRRVVFETFFEKNVLAEIRTSFSVPL
jgi:hypothetical protein